MPWVEIYRFHHPVEAELVKSYLEANGIEARLLQEGAARAIGVYLGPFGEIRLLVPGHVQTEARILLQEFLQRARGEAPPPDDWPDAGPTPS